MNNPNPNPNPDPDPNPNLAQVELVGVDGGGAPPDEREHAHALEHEPRAPPALDVHGAAQAEQPRRDARLEPLPRAARARDALDGEGGEGAVEVGGAQRHHHLGERLG